MSAHVTHRLHVGTSGHRYWPGDVYPPRTSTDAALALYAKQLDSLELNRTFYQVPRASSVDKWQTLVPAHFSWAVKIWRRISHEKKLRDISTDWTLFVERVRPLLTRGTLLLQLPKSFPHDLDVLSHFFKECVSDVRVAVEFRHEFWFSPPIYKLLEKYGVALVGVSAPGVPCVLDIQTADFCYFRLHGPHAWYKDRYTAKEMQPFIKAAERALDQSDVFVYFDNTIGGHAFWNAIEFKEAILGN